MGMVFGDIFWCYPSLLDFVQRVGPGIFCTSTLGLHCFLCACLRYALQDPLFAWQNTEFALSFFYLSSSSHRRAQCIAFGRGECVWLWRGFHAMDLTTSSTSQWIRSRFHKLRAQLACDLSASTSAHHDVYTGGRLFRIMHHWSTNIHVWLPSLWHPSRWYTLHLDT